MFDNVVAKVLRSLSNEENVRATVNEFGMPIGMTFFQYMCLLGRGYVMQLGTENAPIDSTAAIDDQLAWAVVDVPVGVTIAVMEVGVNVQDLGAATLPEFMLEMDNAKVRYSSGGTAFTPLNLHTGKARASGCKAYVGTDITAAAKTAGGSLEVARHALGNDALATQTMSQITNWLYRPEGLFIIEGAGSLVLYVGAPTGDMKAYGNVKWVELS